MMNFKQEELIGDLINHIRKRYPEVDLAEVAESPEDHESLWIIVTAPDDEAWESELITYSADRTMDILLDYRYHMLVMPTRKNGMAVA